MFAFRCYSPDLNCFSKSLVTSLDLTAIVALKYLGISERTKLVNVGNHGGYVCSLFCSHGSGYFVSGSNINSGEDILVLISL